MRWMHQGHLGQLYVGFFSYEFLCLFLSSRFDRFDMNLKWNVIYLNATCLPHSLPNEDFEEFKLYLFSVS